MEHHMSNPRLILQDQLFDKSVESITPAVSYIFIKRILDIFLIVSMLPFIFLVGIVTALAIKLESSGPVFFWQKRVGKLGQPFNMLKFRSMTTDSENNGSQFASNGDARVTKVGKLIRKMRIDEIPQLWNVLKGEMSIIGPRPEQVAFVEKFNKSIPNYSRRHIVSPGITGLAQTEQGYVDDENGTMIKLKFDLTYIENLSFKADVKIVMKTIYTILTGFGAR
jgi:lipopolysaccharide/colanic/teichoic acid biosynthesis glycosyltransferase